MSKYLASLIIILGLIISFQEEVHTQQIAKGEPNVVKSYMMVDPGTG
ncbi:MULTISPECIES: hypothetical protein [Bacillus cereus group]|nr:MULTISPECIES: hypothetical protein [Bacillus cereus group]EJR92641.1 hypothetical protein IKM_06160 [Bacillus mycoides]EJR94964.1 hypothetical protein IKO_05865 [Bacillus cereus VDM034]